MIGVVSKIQIKKSKPHKSYGFIRGGDGNEYWFSMNGVEGVDTDDIVSFKGEKNEKGYIAANVSMFH